MFNFEQSDYGENFVALVISNSLQYQKAKDIERVENKSVVFIKYFKQERPLIVLNPLN